MNAKGPKIAVYAKRLKKVSDQDVYQMAIIFFIILISTLISLLLPVYYALLPLRGS